MSSKSTHKRRLKVRIMAIEHLGGKCIKCGHKGYAASFEFHHRDPSKKEFQISSGNTNSWETVKKEVEKCDLLCSNCHRETHYSSQELEDDIRRHLYDPPIPPRVCSLCGVLVTRRGALCVKCSLLKKQKIDWPSTQEILNKLKTGNFTVLAKQLGVTDTAIRKRIKNHSVTGL